MQQSNTFCTSTY